MTLKQLQRARLAEIASEYRAKGYKVTIGPRPDELPAFLSAFAPDLIAISDADRVIVEVKPLPAIEAERTVQIADAVAANPPWRFQLVTANPIAAPDVPAFAEVAPPETVNEMLADAEQLLQTRHLDAAALVAWSAIEAILRGRAIRSGLELERQSSSALLTELYGLGEIEPPQYERLRRLMDFRNAVAHGFQPRSAAPDIAEIVKEARQMQSAA